MTVLGAGQEVGKSCFLVKFASASGPKRVLLDFGAHLGRQGADRSFTASSGLLSFADPGFAAVLAFLSLFYIYPRRGPLRGLSTTTNNQPTTQAKPVEL